MYPHRIRLRGPWDYEALDVPAGETSSAGRVIMPCDCWDGPGGRVTFRRRFGYPGQIDSHERVWLVFDGVAVPMRVTVNESDLGTYAGAVEVDVTQLLRARSELTVEMTDLAPGSRFWDEVALEVRCTAYLRNVQVTRSGGMILATGEVVGTAAGPLELYLVADRSPAGYAKVDPAGGVQSFSLRTEGTNRDGEPISRVTIELVQGAVAWYSVERAFPEQASGHRGA
jgi:hypothetical protein